MCEPRDQTVTMQVTEVVPLTRDIDSSPARVTGVHPRRRDWEGSRMCDWDQSHRRDRSSDFIQLQGPDEHFLVGDEVGACPIELSHGREHFFLQHVLLAGTGNASTRS